ncbi:hypothetical protein EIN_026280, partial [Entamoeba invadens IP1]|uniref:hypothetical protein n=1 Tax=Entamoeba invadens IP1 TaxID=370355 RepID=UPI0002C3D9D6
MLNTVIKARNVLVSQLAASSTPVDSMKTIQQLLTIQSTSLRLRRRIVLSNLLMKDKTDLTKFSILEQKMHIKNFEDNLEAIRKENALLTKDLDKAESVFQTEDVTRELAASLLGGNVLLNAVSRGQNFGSAEMRKEGDENWEKVAMSLYQNLLFVNKGKSDSVYCIVYINSIYRPVCAEEQSRRF